MRKEDRRRRPKPAAPGAGAAEDPGPGRPTRAQRTDGETTYNRILDVAGVRIAARGFATTTSKEIAAEAGVDLASINYHFGNRSGLYRAVLAEAHRRLLDVKDLDRLMARDIPAAEKLRCLIELVVQGALGELDWPVVVLGREILSPSAYLQAFQQEELWPKLQLLLPMLAEITALPPDDPALLRCIPCVLAPCVMTTLLLRNSATASGLPFNPSRELMIDHLYLYAMGGLQTIARAALPGEPRPGGLAR